MKTIAIQVDEDFTNFHVMSVSDSSLGRLGQCFGELFTCWSGDRCLSVGLGLFALKEMQQPNSLLDLKEYTF